jgi:hypothetical protein
MALIEIPKHNREKIPNKVFLIILISVFVVAKIDIPNEADFPIW